MKKTIKFDFENGDVSTVDKTIVCISGEAALRQWISKILRTAADRFPVYNDTGYGCGVEELVVGKSYEYDFAESEIRREIEEALLKNSEITAVHSFDITVSENTMNAEFTVETVYGTSREAVSI